MDIFKTGAKRRATAEPYSPVEKYQGGDETFAWDPSLNIGIEVMDWEHRSVATELNALAACLQSQAAQETAMAALNGFVEAVRVHFATEERHFRLFAYDAAASHVQKHRDFMKELDMAVMTLDQGAARPTQDQVIRWAQWFREHISVEDKKYADYFLKESDGGSND